MRSLLVISLLHVAAAAIVLAPPEGAQLVQAGSSHRRRDTGMPPCKTCGAARLPSRDDLLYKDDAELNKMKTSLSKEVEDLEEEVGAVKKKNEAELGKLKKRLGDMDAAYKKFGKDAIARSTKFADTKAKANKQLGQSLDNTDKNHKEISKLYASMDEMRKYLNPYVDKLVSGKGWPQGCKCPGAKALLQSLQATLRLAKVDLSADDGASPSQALLRRSAQTIKPADQAKYKLVREVQQLAEKRAKLMTEKTDAITGFGEEQRRALDRIHVAETKANLKASNERKYKDSDDDLEKKLGAQMDAAKSYEDSGKATLARLQKNEAASLKLFKSFKAALQKCNCI